MDETHQPPAISAGDGARPIVQLVGQQKIIMSGNNARIEAKDADGVIYLTGVDSDEDNGTPIPPVKSNTQTVSVRHGHHVANHALNESTNNNSSEGTNNTPTNLHNENSQISNSNNDGDYTTSNQGEDRDSSSSSSPSPPIVATTNQKIMNQQSQRQEVGYVLLEECEVLIPANALYHSVASPVWHSVDMQSSPTSTTCNGGIMGEAKGCPGLPDDTASCDLVLQPSCASMDSKPMASSDNISWRSATDITPFNGLLSEIIAVNGSTASVAKKKSNNDEHSDEHSDGLAAAAAATPKRRSDANLLIGLAVEIDREADDFQQQQIMAHDKSSIESGGGNDNNPHLRQLRMENVQVLFWEEAPSCNSKPSKLQFDNEMDDESTIAQDELTRMQASLLVTFSLPIHEQQRSSPSGDQNNVPKKKSEQKNKSKILSSGFQLIGSIIRCDWGRLDANMKRLQQKALSARKNVAKAAMNEEASRTSHKQQHDPSKKPFFPDSLNVQEMYDRISGAGKHLKASHQRNLVDTNDSSNSNNISKHSIVCSTKAVEFLDLPEDVIATSIATYLRARSLHALRVSNRKMYRSLQTVVPGLKLKLFHHQIRSLEWMEMRERQGDAIFRGEKSFSSEHFLKEGEAVCGGDYHRAVSGGATVLLKPRLEYAKRGIRFDSESGGVVALSPDCEVQRKTRCARGGLLCDDPGLGKTITVISLILRTFGLRTESAVGADQAEGDINSKLFYSYWYSQFLTEHVRKPSILKLITRLIKSDSEAGWFVPPIDHFLDDCPDYFEVIPNPISLQDIRNNYNKSDCRDFKAFEADVRLCFSNAMTYNPPDHAVYKAAERLNKSFDDLLAEFKSEQIKIATKSISRMAKEPTADLVDLFEAKKRAELQKPLVSSSSTLLVVPNPLLRHWEEQMQLHIDFSYITKNDSPPIYHHTSKRNVSSDLRNISDPFIFIDDGSKALPPPTVLARFHIVLTSYNRFTKEWQNGSVEQELRASKKEGSSSGIYWGDDAPEASSLLKVSWLRVIVDEGHVMGKNANNLIQFASWLAAQRHWAMTGTPTQQIASQNGLRNLFHLANFLKHDFFSQRLGREKLWNRRISHPWKAGNLSAFFRLKHITSYLMVRHTKADLIEIPCPTYTTTLISLSQREKKAYNTIASGIRTNLVTTSMEGKTSGWQDSLLNPRQSRYAAEALTNLRIACCGGAQILPQILNKHWNETLEMCRDVHHLDDVCVQVVNNFIYRAQAAELSNCHKCGIQLQTLFVIPCGHLVCSECIDNKTKSCPVCLKPFDVDDFQRLQPGLNFQFSLNLQEEKKEREKQHALKRALVDSTGPGGVINIDELGDMEAEGNASTAGHARRSHRRGEACVYSSRHLDGRCTICREEHFDCNFLNSQRKCSLCFKIAEECPEYNQKSKYVIDKLLQLRNNDFADDGKRRCNVSPMAARLFSKCESNHSSHRPLKAIIFSQFRAVYEYFGDRLIRRFGGACVADYSYARTRSQELQKFIQSADCFVMLLSKQGSVGLDLSFVTHIFFLDTIYDKSLEAQVVARAYRMGATGSVFVEQLIAKDSVEEVMNQMKLEEVVSEALIDVKDKHAKVHTLLKSAKLIRPPHESKAKKRKLKERDQVNLNQAAKARGVRFKD
ncbi:hypothetical protein ACHAXR_010846 [Thalassiosira sp. AJA248-18]